MSEYPFLPLPAALEPLRDLAYNLRWSWNAEARALFERVDAALWEAARHNPVRLLADVAPARLETLARDESFLADLAAASADLDRYLDSRRTWFDRAHVDAPDMEVAYFSAEFAVTECLPIFSGGLGVLAGDHLKSASDLGIPLVAVSLLYREGYFRQEIGADGHQRSVYVPVDPALLPLTLERGPDGSPLLVDFPYLDRRLHARVWRADVGRVPLWLLDTDVEQNRPEDRHITDRLYGGDIEHRLRQEIVLGIGGMRALRALGRAPTVLHLNEGHAAFAAVERARHVAEGEGLAFGVAADRLAAGVVFTTHTPVPAGHDHFSPHLLERYLGGYAWEMGEPWQRFLAHGRLDPADEREDFSMTILAMRLSRRRNGVSRLHGEVSRRMWQELWPDRPAEEVPIGHVTNGVHMPTWVSSPVASLYNRHLGSAWREAPGESGWSGTDAIPDDRLWRARRTLRRALVTEARRRLAAQAGRHGQDPAWTGGALDPDALTIVFARRFATYKRATLLLSRPDRLVRLLTGDRPVQFVFAGKAHPKDLPGQEMLRRIAEFAARPEVRGRFVVLEDYDVELARYLVAGADVWLNVPVWPHEASGTSGMKAAANGALNLSIPDGWWAEAWTDHNALEAPIGWSIGQGGAPADETEQDALDAEALYRLLEHEVVPLFYERGPDGLPAAWLARVHASIGQVVPYFNTHRMLCEYAGRYYAPAHAGEAGRLEEAAIA